MIHKELEHHGRSTRQAEADADSLIATTGLTLAKSEKRPAVIIGTDTDLLTNMVIYLKQLLK
jgi:hypothetical protein